MLVQWSVYAMIDARLRDSVIRADCWIVYEPFRVNASSGGDSSSSSSSDD